MYVLTFNKRLKIFFYMFEVVFAWSLRYKLLKVIPVHGVWVYRRTTQRDTGANDDIDVRGQGRRVLAILLAVLSNIVALGRFGQNAPGERVKR
jgi:hypothetical protein